MKSDSADLQARAAQIKLLLMDCDGVLTDGRLYFSASGEELKVFDVRDGQGIVSWHRAGFRSGVISGRDAGAIISRRAEELGMEFVRVGSVDKARDLAELIRVAGVAREETAFVGDDIGDLEVMRSAGLSFAVGDAVEAVKTAADLVTDARGGRGAIREVVDFLLSARD
jgi:YrbI family 3-deoxy-D-manno-octulosonate 8-phosphate phosphatase